MNPLHNKSEKGFSTLELLIATAILVTAISGSVLVVFGVGSGNSSNPIVFQNQTISSDDQANNEALDKANYMIEHARASASINFDSLVSSSSVDFFHQSLKITDVNPCKKTGVASVSWSTNSGVLERNQLINVDTTFTNPNEALALGGDCGSGSPPISEWWYPTTFTDIDLKDFGAPNSGVSAMGLDVISRNGSKYLLLSVEHSTISVQDFWIFNVDDSSNPYLMGAINTGTTGPGLNDVDGSGNFAFVANDESSKQLQSINITDLYNPDVAASVSLPGVSGSYPEGREVFYYNNRVYIGTLETAGNEFQIFDVSNPSNPTFLNSVQINHSIRSIFVKSQVVGGVTKTIAYLAVSASTVSHNAELMALDVTDPLSITQIGSFNPPGDRDATAIYIIGNKLYLGRTSGSSSEPNFYVLNISNPSAISVLGSKFMKRNPSVGLEVTAIVVSGPFAFLGTDDSNAEFQVYKIENPSNIMNCSEAGYPGGFPGCGKYNFPAKITDLEFYDNLIYASVESNATFRIIYDDISKY